MPLSDVDNKKPWSSFQKMGGGAAELVPSKKPRKCGFCSHRGTVNGQVTLLWGSDPVPRLTALGAGCIIPPLRLAAKNNPESVRGGSCQLAEAWCWQVRMSHPRLTGSSPVCILISHTVPLIPPSVSPFSIALPPCFLPAQTGPCASRLSSSCLPGQTAGPG